MRKLIVFSLLLAIVHGVYAYEIGKTYRIRPSIASNRSLFVVNASLVANADVVLWTETDVPAQQWTVEACANGSLSFRNVYTGQYLSRKSSSLSAGVTMAQTTLNTNARAQWNVVPLEGKDGLYIITPAATGGSSAPIQGMADVDGASVGIVRATNPTEEQAWILEEVDPKSKLTHEMRTEMMDAFISQYVKNVATNRATFSRGGWGEAEMSEILLDALEVTGDDAYRRLYTKIFNEFSNRVGSDYLRLVYTSDYNWFGHEFNDDVMWMVISTIRAYFLVGDEKYRTLARNNFDAIYKRALLWNGMLRWKEDGSGTDASNSCINCPAVIAACYIGKALNKEDYYAKARSIYMSQRAYLYNPSNGHVYDSKSARADNGSYSWNSWCSTYNQGTFIGAALMLYEHYRDPMFANDARLAFQYAVSQLCDRQGIVNVCQTNNNDYPGFKGILMRYVRRLAVDLNDAEAMTWLQKNAMHAYCNRNSSKIACTAWLVKSPENFILSSDGNSDFSNNPFSVSTAVSALFNAPLSQSDFNSNAFDGFEAENYNYMRGVSVIEGQAYEGQQLLADQKSGHFVAYNNVDFGNRPATAITLSLSKISTENCQLIILADSIKGRQLAQVTLAASDDWNEQTFPIEPIEGVHNIYISFKNASSLAKNLYQIDRIRFTSDVNPVSGSLVSSLGELHTSDNVSSAEALVDGSFVTNALVDGNEVQLTYMFPAEAVLSAYRLVPSLTQRVDNLKADWTFETSADGVVWTIADKQNGDLSSANLVCRLGEPVTCRQCRLTLRVADVETFSLAEWQLVGRCLLEDHILADGGRIVKSGDGSVNYTARGTYAPVAYSITAPNDAAAAPKAWALLGSVDNKTWTTLDSRSGQSFAASGVTQFYEIASTSPVMYYKLVVESTEGQSVVDSLQIFGSVASSQKLYHGVLTAGGTFSSSDTRLTSAQIQRALTDLDASTMLAIANNEADTWIAYAAPYPVKPTAFSVVAGDDLASCPSKIKLEASADGTTWKQLYSGGANFTTKGQVRTYALSASTNYSYYRLSLSATQSPECKVITLGEWQLNGLSVATDGSLLTDGGKLTTPDTYSPSGEDASKLTDNNGLTKYCFNLFAPATITYRADAPVKANLYSITSANDSEGRDPASWRLRASSDGVNWTVLDEQTDERFSGRRVTQFYLVDNAEAYSYYQLQILGSVAYTDFLCQMSELQLFSVDDPLTAVNAPLTNASTATMRVAYDRASATLRLPSLVEGTVEVFAVDGERVCRAAVDATTRTIALPYLAKGVYIVRFVAADGSVCTAKFMN